MHHPRTLRAVGLVLLPLWWWAVQRPAQRHVEPRQRRPIPPAAAAPPDCPGRQTAAVTVTITLASWFPQSGLTAAFAEISKGYKAYFD